MPRMPGAKAQGLAACLCIAWNGRLVPPSHPLQTIHFGVPPFKKPQIFEKFSQFSLKLMALRQDQPGAPSFAAQDWVCAEVHQGECDPLCGGPGLWWLAVQPLHLPWPGCCLHRLRCGASGDPRVSWLSTEWLGLWFLLYGSLWISYLRIGIVWNLL